MPLLTEEETTEPECTPSVEIWQEDKHQKGDVFCYAPYETVQVKAESRKSIEELKRTFAEICDPHGNFIMERHKFNTRIQREGELFQSFVADIRILANTCELAL